MSPLLPTINACRAVRPDPLPDVEPELRAPPPRPVDWALDVRARRLHPESLKILREREAVKGWVVAVHVTDAREGLDYHVDLAHEHAARTRVRRVVRGFDPLHWSDPHARWWNDTILPGCALTLLISRRDDEPVLFGDLEVHAVRAGSLVWAAADGSAPGLVPALRRLEGLLLGQPRTLDALHAINNAIVAQNYARNWPLAARLADLAIAAAPDNPAIFWAAACAWAQTGRLDEALAAVRGAIEAPYEDLAELRRDPDLAPLRALPGWTALWRRRRRSRPEAP